MGRPFRVSIPHTSRSIYHLRWRITVVFLVAVFFQEQRLFFVHRQSLAAKYSSTNFPVVSHAPYLRTGIEGSRSQNELLAHREEWKVLGEGWEGKVFAYDDSVIKTFTPGRSPFRNCAPGTTSEKWPTEIDASIRFGGSDINIGSDNGASTTLEGFLPVEAYFKIPPSPSMSPEWHLVTPLMKDGNLNSLAKKLVQYPDTKTFREVDARYRRVFERLLSNLQRLHEAEYCHDDIKPVNIFVRNESSWILGDLGNVRHVAHPYHSSRLWLDNKQLEDCRANDAMRALKSYLKFVQTSANNEDDFNEVFFEGTEPISRLFWRASADAPSISAAQLLELSSIEHPGRDPRVDDTFSKPTVPSSILAPVSKRLALRRAVNQAIQTRMGEKLARWWAMVFVFGIPNTENCSV